MVNAKKRSCAEMSFEAGFIPALLKYLHHSKSLKKQEGRSILTAC